MFDIFCASPYLPDMTDATQRPNLRQRKKDASRDRILDAFIGLLSDGAADLSHDAVAARAGLGRRTVYRYFPDRQALMDGALERVRALAGAGVAYPHSPEELLATLEPIYTGFDRIAPIAVMLRATPQGRALRRAQKAARAAAYTSALAETVKDLPEEDRRLATAMIQVLHTTPWLEMRDQWGLDGRRIARATAWAVRTLLADLRARGGAPLDRE
jgi:AcrR family transcriptional regulator